MENSQNELLDERKVILKSGLKKEAERNKAYTLAKLLEVTEATDMVIEEINQNKADKDFYSIGTIKPEDWTCSNSETYPYQCVINYHCLENSRVDILISPESFSISQQAEICPTCESEFGYVRILAKRIPQGEIKFGSWIFENRKPENFIHFSATAKTDGKIHYTAIWHMKTFSVKEASILYITSKSETEGKTLDEIKQLLIKGSTNTAVKTGYSYTGTATSHSIYYDAGVGTQFDRNVYSRAYVVLEDENGNEQIIYSDMISNSYNQVKSGGVVSTHQTV